MLEKFQKADYDSEPQWKTHDEHCSINVKAL